MYGSFSNFSFTEIRTYMNNYLNKESDSKTLRLGSIQMQRGSSRAQPPRGLFLIVQGLVWRRLPQDCERNCRRGWRTATLAVVIPERQDVARIKDTLENLTECLYKLIN